VNGCWIMMVAAEGVGADDFRKTMMILRMFELIYLLVQVMGMPRSRRKRGALRLVGSQ
jgi:hypothetical protein